MLFAVGLRNFKISFLKILSLGAFRISGSSLFFSMITDGKKVFFEEAVFNFEMRNIICLPCRVWSGYLNNYIKKIFWRWQKF